LSTLERCVRIFCATPGFFWHFYILSNFFVRMTFFRDTTLAPCRAAKGERSKMKDVLPTLDQIAAQFAATLAAAHEGASIREALIPAAVLVPLIDVDGEVLMLFTQRADHLSAHAGQVSFPGGTVDVGDASLAATALREAEEEIGLSAQAVRVLGRLPQQTTVSGFAVTPIIGALAATTVLTPNPKEVAAVFHVPLAHLWDESQWSRETLQRGEQRFITDAIHYEGYHIWGATARMVRRFCGVLRGA
jgi:8-oxo-dGTP pyrophosphatase MutT (NUDIX family)